MTLSIAQDSEIATEENSVLSLIQDTNIEAEFGAYIWEEVITSTNVNALSDLLVLISIRLRALEVNG